MKWNSRWMMNEMGRYSKHCGRVIVSGLWAYCPFCGDSLEAQSASKVEQHPEVGPKQRPDLAPPEIIPPLDSLKVSELRSKIKALGCDLKARTKVELKEIYLKALANSTVDWDILLDPPASPSRTRTTTEWVHPKSSQQSYKVEILDF